MEMAIALFGVMAMVWGLAAYVERVGFGRDEQEKRNGD